jgi:N-hydroxyarylamine O-acetyltransferase
MTPNELDHYFARIDYRGPRAPTLPVLHALTAAHTRSIPFENIDVLLGRGVDISDDAVFEKLVLRRRGGYCFEQNGLFMRVLVALGFQVKPLSARVRLDRPRDFTPARTHMFLHVTVDGDAWFTDVGVGGASLTSAIRFEPGLEQPTPHEDRRITREGDRYFHQVRFGSEWTDVYEFTGESMPRIDREVGNWFTSTHPDSHFRQRLIAARAEREGRRLTLLNAELKTRERGGQATVRAIASHGELIDLLRDRFGLELERDTRIAVPGLT